MLPLFFIKFQMVTELETPSPLASIDSIIVIHMHYLGVEQAVLLM